MQTAQASRQTHLGRRFSCQNKPRPRRHATAVLSLLRLPPSSSHHTLPHLQPPVNMHLNLGIAATSMNGAVLKSGSWSRSAHDESQVIASGPLEGLAAKR